ncbi:MAG TPA: hypothetical protein VNF02_06250 [Candidatus Limnocylindrales bacterium]|nr:hypothetical protein [Candidatus Limnocylindrales bacterium]
MLVYGLVEYHDAFNRKHETRYCFVYIVKSNKIPYSGYFEVGGPLLYNKTT